MIKQWIAEYDPKTEADTLSALREIMQEITLAGLSRTDFFEHAAFYGGTALRIFYDLERYSEDLDFSLLKPNSDFSIQPYFKAIIDEFDSMGLTVSVRSKEKTSASAIDSAFLKTQTIWKEIVLDDIVKALGIKSNQNVKIKLEVDRQPPLLFNTEEKLLLRPFSFYVKCVDKSGLFAGKLHALLFRKWKNRVKGRDWFDFQWYVKNGIPLDLTHFLERAKNTNDWSKEDISESEIRQMLYKKIQAVSFASIKQDVVRFIKDDAELEIWNARYFEDLVDKMKFR